MDKMVRLATKIERLREQLAGCEAEFQRLRLEQLRRVEISKNGETVTLKFGSRVVKAKRHARYSDRWNLTENGQKIATEVFGSIHDIRFAIAGGGL
jgi:hypothetical protein